MLKMFQMVCGQVYFKNNMTHQYTTMNCESINLEYIYDCYSKQLYRMKQTLMLIESLGSDFISKHYFKEYMEYQDKLDMFMDQFVNVLDHYMEMDKIFDLTDNELCK